MLDGSIYRWVAGYSMATPWFEGTFCDLTFFRILMDGVFRRTAKGYEKWDMVEAPRHAASELYRLYPQAVDLRFSLFDREPGTGRIRSTLEDHLEALERAATEAA